MDRLLHIRTRFIAKSLLEFLFPYLRRRLRIVAYPPKHLQKMPVTLELIIIILITPAHQVKGLFLRMHRHLRRQHRFDLEPLPAVQMRALGKPPHIFRVAPQQKLRRPPVPDLPMHLVLLGILQQVRILMTPIMLVAAIDMPRMKRHTQLLGPVLSRDPKPDTRIDRLLYNRIGKTLGPKIHPDITVGILDRLEHAAPEIKQHLLVPRQTRLPVHPKLQGIQVGNDL